MNTIKNRVVFLVAAMVMVLAFALPAAAAVTVYAEGAYTDSDLVVYIYADIDTDAICSAGVKLTYDNTVLTVAAAEKNDDVWYMGDGTTNETYMDPEDVGDGVIVICGKLDTADPTAGVMDSRVLLGKVTFNIVGAPITTPVADPEAHFGISVELGRGGDFANFVTVAGTEIDDAVVFDGAIVRERGDANASGDITSADMFKIRSLLGSGEYIVYADCNGSGDITGADMFCVRSKL